MYHVQKNIKTLLFSYYSNYHKRRKSRAHLRAKFCFPIFGETLNESNFFLRKISFDLVSQFLTYQSVKT